MLRNVILYYLHIISRHALYQGKETQSWAHLYCDTFTPVLFVKVLEHACTFCESIRTKYRVPEHHPLVFFKVLQYHYIKHGIVFHA